MKETATTQEETGYLKLIRGLGYVLHDAKNGEPIDLHKDEVVSKTDDRVKGQGHKFRPATPEEVELWANRGRAKKPPVEGGGETSEDRSSDGDRSGAKIAAARAAAAKSKGKQSKGSASGDAAPDPFDEM